MHLEILVEELSMAEALEILVPQIVPGHTLAFIHTRARPTSSES